MKALKISLLVFFISSFTWIANANLTMLDQNGVSYFNSTYGSPNWNQIIRLGTSGSAGCYTIDNDPNGAFSGLFDVFYGIPYNNNYRTISLNVNIMDAVDWVLIYENTPWDTPELVAIVYGEYNGTYTSKYSLGEVYIRVIKIGNDDLYPPAPFRGVYFSW